MTTIDLESLADTVTESSDPITPDTGVEDQSDETRDNVLSYVSSFVGNGRGRRERKGRRSREPKEPKGPKIVPPKPRAGTLKKPLMELYGSVGLAVGMFDPVCGTAIVANAEQCAVALENAARENEALRRFVLSLIQTSVWGQLIVAHLPILLAIAMHHVPALKQSGMTQSMENVVKQQREKTEQELAEERAYYESMDL